MVEKLAKVLKVKPDELLRKAGSKSASNSDA